MTSSQNWVSNNRMRFIGPRLLHLAALVLLVQLAASVAAWAADEAVPFPLEPPDTSSPRATLEGFMDYNQKGAKALRDGEKAETTIY